MGDAAWKTLRGLRPGRHRSQVRHLRDPIQLTRGSMSTITQLREDITRYEADAAYYEEYAKRCRSEAALLREELENERAGKRPALEEAHRLAEAILRLDGLTGAEIEAAEGALSDEPADIQRLRQIAANHSLTLDFL
jgi:hypothetical protein